MSLIAQLRNAKAALAAAQAQLDSIQSNPELKRMQEFEAKQRALLAEYNMSLVDVNTLMDPEYKPRKIKAEKLDNNGDAKTPKARSTRTFTNPHTGEKILYVGGVNKQLEEWKAKWGKDTVKTWGVLNK